MINENSVQLKNIFENAIIYENYPMKNFTYPQIGGKADYLLLPSSYDEARKIVLYAKENDIPITIIGNGSNTIIKDGGLRGFVISLKKLSKIIIKDKELIAQGGANLIIASFKALAYHLAGFEFACGIPATIGGAVNMNAGAYGDEIKDTLTSCLVLTKDGDIVTRHLADLEYSYRSSNISSNSDIVLEATFKLKKGDYNIIKDKMLDLTRKRFFNQPLEYPSCGSVFKRPVGHYAGKLIQEAKLQGIRIGGAQVSKKHAGFIVNVDQSTADDFISLINYIKQTIKDYYDINLEQEIRIIGEDLT